MDRARFLKTDATRGRWLKRWFATGEETPNLYHLFSDWWGQLDFHWLADSAVRQVGLCDKNNG